MQFTLGNHTSIGRVRTANEDAFGNWLTPNGHLFVVCDGMGGHIGGAIASQAAASAIYQTMASQKFPSGPIALEYCLQEANRKLRQMIAANPSLHGMGTTAVAVLLQGDAAYFAHIGDSRLYLFRQNNLRRLTRDHSYVQSLVDQGHITEVEAEKHPRRNEIYRALGIDEEVEPAAPAAPIMLQPGDRLMLCTDGLNGMIGDKGIASVMSTRGLSVQQQAEKLVTLADEAGGHDNTTVQIILLRPTLKPLVGEAANTGSAIVPPPVAPEPVPEVENPEPTPVEPAPVPESKRRHRLRERIMKPLAEKPQKERKPILPLVGGITLFAALILLLYNFLRTPDAPRLGMEGADYVDTTDTTPALQNAAIDTFQQNSNPIPAPVPTSADTVRVRKSVPPKDSVQATAPSGTVPASKKDSTKRPASKALPNTSQTTGTDTVSAVSPKAVLPAAD